VSVVANVAINVDARGAAKELTKVNDAAAQLNQTFGALKLAVAALGIGAAVRSIAQVGNESQKSKIQIQALTAQYGELNQASASIARIQKVLGISAIDAREGYGQLYAALRATGVTTQQLEVLFVGLTKAARLSGAGAAEAQGALLQLKQAFASGTLSGDELRAVLEAMPAFTQAVAKETDRLGLTTNATSADIKKLGSEGKITSDILFAASKKLALANAPGTTSTEQLAAAFKDLQERIAEAFGPAIISAANTLFGALTGIGNWFKANQGAITAFAKGFVDIAKTVGPIAAGIFVVVKAYQAWQAVSQALAATQAFITALTGPKGLALIAAAAGASAVAYKTLGDLSANVSNEIAKQRAEAEKAKNEFNSIANSVEGIAGKTKPATEGIKSMATEAERGQRAIEAQISSLERGASVNSARYEAEKAINDLQGQQLERQYGLAQTAQQRLNIAIAIFNQQADAARIEYQQALSNIELEKTKVALQQQAAALKYRQIEASGKLAILEAKSVEEERKKKEQLREALDAQKGVIAGAQETSRSQQQIAQYQKQTASTQLESKLLAAQIALESKATSDGIGMSNTNAARLSSNLAGSAKEAILLRDNMNQAAYATERAANAIRVLNANSATPTGGSFIKAHNASGGYISRPTATMVGEAGGEYIVPESKASNFAANYLAGGRGAGALMGGGGTPSISIQTGPVTQMNGTNYVTTQDMRRAVQSGVEQTLKLISGDASIRSSVGIR
jgi:tape measure domain-containing protein